MCNENNGSCLASLLENIILLQQTINNTIGCDQPILGSIAPIANTRPLNLYSCCNGTMWNMPYTIGDTTGTSTFFRVENVNDNCATFRILISNGDTYTSTNNYFTVNLKCIGAIKCLTDTFVNGI